MKKSRHEKIERVPESGCWVWTAATNEHGYGICGDGLVHRWMYAQHKGDIPDGLCVLHTCDVRCCCNPDHLYLGTQKDNMRDMLERGRVGDRGQKPGERHAMAKLTRAQVDQMRGLYSAGTTQKSLSTLFGISRAQTHRIVRGKRWAAA